jgi:hypothetical protein
MRRHPPNAWPHSSLYDRTLTSQRATASGHTIEWSAREMRRRCCYDKQQLERFRPAVASVLSLKPNRLIETLA